MTSAGVRATNWSAIASLMFGVVGVVLALCGLIPYVGFLIAVTAFVPASIATALGQVGLARAERTGHSGRSVARAGFVLGCASVALIFGTFAFWSLGMFLVHGGSA